MQGQALVKITKEGLIVEEGTHITEVVTRTIQIVATRKREVMVFRVIIKNNGSRETKRGLVGGPQPYQTECKARNCSA